MFEQQEKWSDLLNEAVREPGLILEAYTAFHNYSVGNQVAAMVQCVHRGLTPGPINTYKGWLSLGRQVKKGERALWLCMPFKRKGDGGEGDEVEVITSFAWKRKWFILSQTEGEPIEPVQSPDWNKARALAALNITETPFTGTDGNVQGYAKGREVSISPIAAMPHKTLFHEIAHVELGHTAESDFTDSEVTPRSLREAEAEAVALLVCESLELPGTEYSRGYMQTWLRGDVIPEKSAMKIFGAADRILKAGQAE